MNILATVDGKKWLFYIRDNVRPFSHIDGEQKKNNKKDNEDNTENNQENNEEDTENNTEDNENNEEDNQENNEEDTENNEEDTENNEEDSEEDDEEEDNEGKKPGIHAIVGIYTVDAYCYGYDIILDKYINLKYYMSKIEQYIDTKDLNEYKYFQLNGQRKGLMIKRIFNKETNRNETTVDLINIEGALEKSILDITTIKNKHKAGIKEDVKEVGVEQGDMLAYLNN